VALALVAGAAAGVAPEAAAGPPAARFAVARLAVDGDVLGLVPADLDGDGRLDLLAAYRTGLPPRQKRFLAVFWNQGRRFSPRPDQVIAVDDGETCAFDVADVDGQKGAEILLVTPRGVDALALRGRKLGGKFPLVVTPTLFHRAAPGELPRLSLSHELGAAGGPHLLVPALGALEVYRRAGEGYTRLGRLAVAVESRMRGQGRARARPSGSVGALNVTHTFPALAIADTDGDGRKDIVASLEDRMEVFPQRADAAFDERPAVRRDFGVRSAAELTDMSSGAAITVTDVDGDGVADVVVRKQVSRGISSAATTSFIYFGRKGASYPERPDQVIRSEGASGTEVELFDVTGDGRTDLVVPSVNIGVMAIIRILTTKTLKVNFQIFPFQPATRRFAERPAAERELKFKVSLSGEAGVQAADMRGDYNGDGKPDLAFGTDDDELSIFPGTGGKSLFDDDALEEIAVPAFGTLEAVDLDRQGKSDMVLHYPNTKGQRNQIVVLLNHGPW
jgi:hypothetical protein